MTDKQIIINGVDVSRCSNYDHNSYFECKVYYCHCDEIPNCYSKQLNQLKEDNEELKKQLQAQHAFTRHEQKLIYCVAYDETCKTGNDCKQEKCIFKDNIKLKQTLTEIKEYLIKECKICKEQCAITNEDCADCQAQEILQKISEVENA